MRNYLIRIKELFYDFPSIVRELHREFALCGADVLEAFVFYGTDDKLNVGRSEHNKLDVGVKVIITLIFMLQNRYHYFGIITFHFLIICKNHIAIRRAVYFEKTLEFILAKYLRKFLSQKFLPLKYIH